MFADDSGNQVAILASSLIHGVAYLALAMILRREAARFATANLAARLARRILLIDLTALGVGMIAVQPVVILAVQPAGAFEAGWGLIGTLLLLTLAIGSIVLGLAVLRNNPLGVGGRVLGALIPAVLLTVVLGFLAPTWGHPGYVETVMNFGMALVGVGAAKITHDSRAHTTAVAPTTA